MVNFFAMCCERLRFITDYRETTRIYADSVWEMTDLVGLGIDTEVDLLRRACKMAWDAAERARLALYRYEANHGCDRKDLTSAASAGSSGG
jgi:hypothetical protein